MTISTSDFAALSDLIGLPTIAAATAVLLHQLILKHHEVDHLTLKLTTISNVAFISVWHLAGFALAISTWVAFYGTLSATILIYRAYFHPLRDFPGPFGAKLSKWWTVKQTWDSNFGFFKVVNPRLRHEYGDYVRTGPREISIFDTAAIAPILGYNSKTTKGPYYDVFERSLQLNRDKDWHRQRRRVWDNGMKQSLADYGPRIEEFTTQLLDRIELANGEMVPLNEFFYHYSYDVMSALAFGNSMGFSIGQSSEVANRIIDVMASSLHGLGLLCHVPWFMNSIATLTSSFGPMKLWEDWTREQLGVRRALKDPKPDLMMHLLARTPRTPEGDRLLFGESRLIISAGSDTTANNLTLIFVQLALHPEYQAALRKECFGAEYSCLHSLPLLDAVINESMRLWPAVYFPSQRVTPGEGLQIPGGLFIPGHMIVAVPSFALAHDERNFVQPDDFIPERWTNKPELCIDKSAFFPFLIGPNVCAGKSLAMMEMRSVVHRVIENYNVVLPDGFDAKTFFAGIKDHWVAGVPKQDIKFVPLRWI